MAQQDTNSLFSSKLDRRLPGWSEGLTEGQRDAMLQSTIDFFATDYKSEFANQGIDVKNKASLQSALVDRLKQIHKGVTGIESAWQTPAIDTMTEGQRQAFETEMAQNAQAPVNSVVSKDYDHNKVTPSLEQQATAAFTNATGVTPEQAMLQSQSLVDQAKLSTSLEGQSFEATKDLKHNLTAPLDEAAVLEGAPKSIASRFEKDASYNAAPEDYEGMASDLRFADPDYALFMAGRAQEWAKSQIAAGVNPETVERTYQEFIQRFDGGLKEVQRRTDDLNLFDVKKNGGGLSGLIKTVDQAAFPFTHERRKRMLEATGGAETGAYGVGDLAMQAADVLSLIPRANLAGANLAIRTATGGRRGWSIAESMIPNADYGVPQVKKMLVNQFGLPEEVVEEPELSDALFAIKDAMATDPIGTMAMLTAESYRDATGRVVTGMAANSVGKGAGMLARAGKKAWLLRAAAKAEKMARMGKTYAPLATKAANWVKESALVRTALEAKGSAKATIELAKMGGGSTEQLAKAIQWTATKSKQGALVMLKEIPEEAYQGGAMSALMDVKGEKGVADIAKDAAYEGAEAVFGIPGIMGIHYALGRAPSLINARAKLHGESLPEVDMVNYAESARKNFAWLDANKKLFTAEEIDFLEEERKLAEAGAKFEEAAKAGDLDGVAAAHDEMLALADEREGIAEETVITNAMAEGEDSGENATFEDAVVPGLPQERDQQMTVDRFSQPGLRTMAAGHEDDYTNFGFPVDVAHLSKQQRSELRNRIRESRQAKGLFFPENQGHVPERFGARQWVALADRAALESFGDANLMDQFATSADRQLRELAQARYNKGAMNFSAITNAKAAKVHHEKLAAGADIFNVDSPAKPGQRYDAELRAAVVKQQGTSDPQAEINTLASGHVAYQVTKSALSRWTLESAIEDDGNHKPKGYGSMYYLPWRKPFATSQMDQGTFPESFVEQKARDVALSAMGMKTEHGFSAHPGMAGNEYEMVNIKRDVHDAVEQMKVINVSEAPAAVDMAEFATANQRAFQSKLQELDAAYQSLKGRVSKENMDRVKELQIEWGIMADTFSHEMSRRRSQVIAQKNAARDAREAEAEAQRAAAAAAAPAPTLQEQVEAGVAAINGSTQQSGGPEATAETVVKELGGMVATLEKSGPVSFRHLDQDVTISRNTNGISHDVNVADSNGKFATYTIDQNGTTKTAESEGREQLKIRELSLNPKVESLEKLDQTVTTAAAAVAEANGEEAVPQPSVTLNVAKVNEMILRKATPGVQDMANEAQQPNLKQQIQDFMDRYWFNPEVSEKAKRDAAEAFLHDLAAVRYRGRMPIDNSFTDKVREVASELASLNGDPMAKEKAAELLSRNRGYLFEGKDGSVLPVKPEEAMNSRRAHELQALSREEVAPYREDASINIATRIGMDGFVSEGQARKLVGDSAKRNVYLQMPGIQNMHGSNWVRLDGQMKRNGVDYVRLHIPASTNEDAHEKLIVPMDSFVAYMTAPSRHTPAYEPDTIGTIHAKAITGKMSKSMQRRAQTEGWRTAEDLGGLISHIVSSSSFPSEFKVSGADLSIGDEILVNDNGKAVPFTVSSTKIGGIAFKTIVNKTNPSTPITFWIGNGKMLNVLEAPAKTVLEKAAITPSPEERALMDGTEEGRQLVTAIQAQAEADEKQLADIKAQAEEQMQANDQVIAKAAPPAPPVGDGVEAAPAPGPDAVAADAASRQNEQLYQKIKQAEDKLAETKRKLVEAKNKLNMKLDLRRLGKRELTPEQMEQVIHYPESMESDWVRQNSKASQLNDDGQILFNEINDRIYQGINSAEVSFTSGGQTRSVPNTVISTLVLNDALGDGANRLGLGSAPKRVDIVTESRKTGNEGYSNTKFSGIQNLWTGVAPYQIKAKNYDLVSYISDLDPAVRSTSERFHEGEKDVRQYAHEEAVILARASEGVKVGGIVQAVISPTALARKDIRESIKKMAGNGRFIQMSRIKGIRLADNIERISYGENASKDDLSGRNPATDGIVLIWQKNNGGGAEQSFESLTRAMEMLSSPQSAQSVSQVLQSMAASKEVYSSLRPSSSSLAEGRYGNKKSYIERAGEVEFRTFPERSDEDVRPSGERVFSIGATDALTKSEIVADKTADMVMEVLRNSIMAPSSKPQVGKGPVHFSPIIQVHIDQAHRVGAYDTGMDWPVGYGINAAQTIDPDLVLRDRATGQKITDESILKAAAAKVAETAAEIPVGQDAGRFTDTLDPTHVALVSMKNGVVDRVTIGRPFVTDDWAADLISKINARTGDTQNITFFRADNKANLENAKKRFKEVAAAARGPIVLITGPNGYFGAGNYRGGAVINMRNSPIKSNSVQIRIENGSSATSIERSIAISTKTLADAVVSLTSANDQLASTRSDMLAAANSLGEGLQRIAQSQLDIPWVKAMVGQMEDPMFVSHAMKIDRHTAERRIADLQRLVNVQVGQHRRTAKAILDKLVGQPNTGYGIQNYQTNLSNLIASLRQGQVEQAWLAVPGVQELVGKFDKATAKIQQIKDVREAMQQVVNANAKLSELEVQNSAARNQALVHSEKLVSSAASLALSKAASALPFNLDVVEDAVRDPARNKDPLAHLSRRAASLRNPSLKWEGDAEARRQDFLEKYDAGIQKMKTSVEALSKLMPEIEPKAAAALMRQFVDMSIMEQWSMRDIPDLSLAADAAQQMLHAQYLDFVQEANAILAEQPSYKRLSPSTFLEKMEVPGNKILEGVLKSEARAESSRQEILDERDLAEPRNAIGKVRSDYVGQEQVFELQNNGLKNVTEQSEAERDERGDIYKQTEELRAMLKEKDKLGQQLDEIESAFDSFDQMADKGLAATRHRDIVFGKYNDLKARINEKAREIGARTSMLDGEREDSDRYYAKEVLRKAQARNYYEAKALAMLQKVAETDGLSSDNLFQQRFLTDELQLLNDLDAADGNFSKVVELEAIESKHTSVMEAMQRRYNEMPADEPAAVALADQIENQLSLIEDVQEQIEGLVSFNKSVREQATRTGAQAGKINDRTLLAMAGGSMAIMALMAKGGMPWLEEQADGSMKMYAGVLGMVVVGALLGTKGGRNKLANLHRKGFATVIPAIGSNKAFTFFRGDLDARLSMLEEGALGSAEISNRARACDNRKDKLQGEILQPLMREVNALPIADQHEFVSAVHSGYAPNGVAAKQAFITYQQSLKMMAALQAASPVQDYTMFRPSARKLDATRAMERVLENLDLYLDQANNFQTPDQLASGIAYELGGAGLSDEEGRVLCNRLADELAKGGQDLELSYNRLLGNLHAGRNGATTGGVLVMSPHPEIRFDDDLYDYDLNHLGASISYGINYLVNAQHFGGEGLPWLKDRFTKIGLSSTVTDKKELAKLIGLTSIDIGQDIGIRALGDIEIPTLGDEIARRKSDKVGAGVRAIKQFEWFTKIALNLKLSFLNPTQAVISAASRGGLGVTDVPFLVKSIVRSSSQDVRNIVDQLTSQGFNTEQMTGADKPWINELMDNNVLRLMAKNYGGDPTASMVRHAIDQMAGAAGDLKSMGAGARSKAAVSTLMSANWELYKYTNRIAFKTSMAVGMVEGPKVLSRLLLDKQEQFENYSDMADMQAAFGSKAAVESILERGEMTRDEQIVYATHFTKKANGTSGRTLDKPGLFSSEATSLLGMFQSVPRRIENDVTRHTLLPLLSPDSSPRERAAAANRMKAMMAGAMVAATVMGGLFRMAGWMDDRDKKAYAPETGKGAVPNNDQNAAINAIFNMAGLAADWGMMSWMGGAAGSMDLASQKSVDEFIYNQLFGAAGSDVSNAIKEGINYAGDAKTGDQAFIDLSRKVVPGVNQVGQMAEQGFVDLQRDIPFEVQGLEHHQAGVIDLVSENPALAAQYMKPFLPYGFLDGKKTNSLRYQNAIDRSKEQAKNLMTSRLQAIASGDEQFKKLKALYFDNQDQGDQFETVLSKREILQMKAAQKKIEKTLFREYLAQNYRAGR